MCLKVAVWNIRVAVSMALRDSESQTKYLWMNFELDNSTLSLMSAPPKNLQSQILQVRTLLCVCDMAMPPYYI
jgi:hypothetical protein